MISTICNPASSLKICISCELTLKTGAYPEATNFDRSNPNLDFIKKKKKKKLI